MQFTPIQKLDRLLITQEAVINGHCVYRASDAHYVVDGVHVRKGHESDARFLNRLRFAVTGDSQYSEQETERSKRARAAAKERKARQKHACVDCGADCFKPYPRCRKCAYEQKRQYPHEQCKVCGEAYAPYAAGGRGSRVTLNAAGVCTECAKQSAK